MKRRFLTLLIVAMVAGLGATTALADAPTGYYRTLVNKKDQELKDAIYALVRPHTIFSYNSLWYYFVETDPMPENPNRVWDMYSDKEYFFSSTRGNATSGMNKEHSFPKSWWGGSTNKEDFPSYTDLHHLVPSDASANTAKSNWPLGVVYTASFNNGVSKAGTPVTGQGGGAQKVFEPDDRYKGDFARMYFYVATCYQDYDWATTWMVDNYDVNWRTLNDWSVALLLKWAREDPVSEKEIARNDAVFRFQNNRNPFIDDPELCEYIWGNRKGQVYTYDHSGEVNPDPDPGTGNPQLVTPTQGTLLDFGEVALGDSAVLTLYVKGESLTQNLNLQLYRYNYQMFSIPVTSIAYADACSEEGYALEITYKPTALGDHKAKLLFTGGGFVGSVAADIKATCVEAAAIALNGDINNDGNTDVTDVSLLIDLILGNTTGDEYFYVNNPDINDDGVEDVSDVSLLIDIILGNIQE